MPAPKVRSNRPLFFQYPVSSSLFLILFSAYDSFQKLQIIGQETKHQQKKDDSPEKTLALYDKTRRNKPETTIRNTRDMRIVQIILAGLETRSDFAASMHP